MTGLNEDVKATGPLSGIVIADFSRVLAGPYATVILADLGATVIKVEGPQGDDTRSWMPPAYEGVASYYQAVNRNKHAITLEFTDPEDLEIAKQIATKADVFIHNFKPGSIEKFGLGYEAIRALNPSVIYTHISGFGSQEPGRNLPGYDILVQGMSGLMDMNGDPDGPPVRSGVSLFDLTAGMMTAVGIASALRHREVTGEGQLLENNLLSNAIFTMANQYQVATTTETVPTRLGKEHGTIYPYNQFPTADGDLIVVAANNGQFHRLCKVLGLDGLAEDERFSSPEKRNLNRDQLRPLLEEALGQQGRQAWYRELTAAGLPVAPVQNVLEGYELAKELGLDPLWTTGQEGDLPTIRNSLTFSQTPASYRKTPPAMNEDAEAIRAWLDQEA